MSIAVERPLDEAAVSHYRFAAPIMEKLFGRIPFLWTSFDDAGRETWHNNYFGNYYWLSAQKIEHFVEKLTAREFYSWACTVDDADRARFVRLLLTRYEGISDDLLRMAALAVRAMLAHEGFEAIPMLDAASNLALWVPVANGPHYDAVRTWAHGFAKRVIATHGDLVSTLPNTHHDGRVHLHISHNAPHLGTMLPYSLRFRTQRVATPFRWLELGTIDLAGATPDEIQTRVAKHGEIFGAELATITPSPIPDTVAKMIVPMEAHKNPSGYVIGAVVQILADGKPRTAAELLHRAIELGLIGADTRESSLYINLTQSIERALGRGRKPPIVQMPDRRFRINEPLDLWPDVPVSPQQPVLPEVQRLIDRLESSKSGADPTAFEVAVCDAFEALGFRTTHVGGVGNPDGYMDAKLGTLGYRVMLECKTGPSGIVQDPKVFEAAKFRDGYDAQYCALVGPEFPAQQFDVTSELRAHGVSVWTTDDIETLLRIGADAYEIRSAFEPGFAEDAVRDVLWHRIHGQRKRVQWIAQAIIEAGWAAQSAAAEAATPTDAPILSEDAAMLLVDQALAAQDAHVDCSREDVRAAFDWLTSPMVGAAVWNADKTGLVVTKI